MEIPDSRTFDQVRDAAQDAWDQVLGRVEVEGATADQLTTLYSNLYRLYLYPNSAFENTGTAAAPKYQYASPVQPAAASTPTQTGAKIVDGKMYVNNGFWDTYRTTWPAYSLLTPEQGGGDGRRVRPAVPRRRVDRPLVVAGLRQPHDRHQLGRRLRRRLPKGVPLRTSRRPTRRPSATRRSPRRATRNNSNVGRKGLQQSIFLGYTPTTVGEGVSWALEGYVNDYGIAKMAEKLSGEPKLDQATRDRYRTEAAVLPQPLPELREDVRPQGGLLPGLRRERHVPSKTPAQYNPLDWGGDYTETDGWNFAFHAPQDGQGLANLYGGRAGLATKLDQFFATPEDADAPRRLRRRHPRDARGARRPDGPAGHEQPGLAPHPVHVRLRGTALEDGGEGPRDHVAALLRQRDRPGVRR